MNANTLVLLSQLNNNELVELAQAIATELVGRKESNGNQNNNQSETNVAVKSTKTSTKSKKTLKGLVGLGTLKTGTQFSFANSKRFYTITGPKGNNETVYGGMNGSYSAKNEVLVKAIAA